MYSYFVLLKKSVCEFNIWYELLLIHKLLCTRERSTFVLERFTAPDITGHNHKTDLSVLSRAWSQVEAHLTIMNCIYSLEVNFSKHLFTSTSN